MGDDFMKQGGGDASQNTGATSIGDSMKKFYDYYKTAVPPLDDKNLPDEMKGKMGNQVSSSGISEGSKIPGMSYSAPAPVFDPQADRKNMDWAGQTAELFGKIFGLNKFGGGGLGGLGK